MTNSLQTIRAIWGADDLGDGEVIVRSNAELKAALDAIGDAGGGTILLDAAGGPYDVSVRGHRGADGPLVITSLDAQDPATVRSLDVYRSETVAVADVKLDGGPVNRAPEGRVSESKKIVLVGIEATGRGDGFLSEDGDAQRGDSAFLVRDSRDVTIADSTFFGLNHAVGAVNTTGFRMIGNDVSGIQGDGFRGGGIQDALFEGNHFHDFYGSTQTLNHSDMIQLWSSNVGQINARVVIRDNVFDAGEMAATQTIFIGHEAYGRPERGPSAAYEDITIEGNVIFNGARNGIVVAATNDAVIRDNTVLWSKDATTKTNAASKPGNDVPWIITSDMPGLVLENNITPNVKIGDNARYQEFRAQNVILDFLDPSDPNYAYDHIVDLDGGDVRDLELRADSPFFGVAGAPMSSPAGKDGAVSPPSAPPSAPPPSAPPSEPQTAPPSAPPSPPQDVPPKTGAGSEHVAFDFSVGIEDLSVHGAEVAIHGQNYLGDGTFLLRPDTGLSMGRKEAQLTNLEAFEIEVGFAKSTAGATGALVGQHDRLEVGILPDGGIRFVIKTTEGWFDVRTPPGLVLDAAAHDLVLGFDAGAGTMTITLDGALVAQGRAGGMLTANGGHTLGLGKSFEPNVEAEIDSFVVRAPEAVGGSAVPDTAPPPSPAVTAPEVPIDEASGEGPAPELQILRQIDFDGIVSEGIRLKDPNGAAAGAEGLDGFGFALDGRSKVIVSDRADVLEGVDGFEMTTAISKAAANGQGTILSVYGNMDLKVLSDGSLKLWLRTDADDYTIRSEAGLMSTTDWHDVGVRFDGIVGEMAILLGGEEVVTGEARGAMPEMMAHHLMAGRAFGGSVAARIDDVVLAIAPSVGVDQFEFAAPSGGDGAADAAYAAASIVLPSEHDQAAADLAADIPGGDDVTGSGDGASLADLTDTVLVG